MPITISKEHVEDIPSYLLPKNIEAKLCGKSVARVHAAIYESTPIPSDQIIITNIICGRCTQSAECPLGEIQSI